MTVERLIISDKDENIDPLTIRPDILIENMEIKQQVDAFFKNPCPVLTIDPQELKRRSLSKKELKQRQRQRRRRRKWFA